MSCSPLTSTGAEQGTMANFTFHGVGGDYLSVSAEAHERLLRYLHDNRNIFWVDTFLAIMNHVKAHGQESPPGPGHGERVDD